MRGSDVPRMNAETPIRKPRGAFFGRRKGHPLRAGQAGLIESLLPGLALDLRQPAPRDISTLFKAPVDAVRLEIGFAGAHHLLHQPRLNPDSAFLACAS